MIMESVHNTGQRRDVGKKHFAFCQNNKVNTGTGMISYSKGLVLHIIRHSLMVTGGIDSEILTVKMMWRICKDICIDSIVE